MPLSLSLSHTHTHTHTHLLVAGFSLYSLLIAYLLVCLPCSYDSDNPRVYADVGMTGVAIDSVEDMKVRFCSCTLTYSNVQRTRT